MSAVTDILDENVDWNRLWERRVRRAHKKGRISKVEKRRMLGKLEFDGIATSASDKAAGRVP